MSIIASVKNIAIGLILLTAVVLPFGAQAAASANWTSLGLTAAMAGGLVAIVVIFYLFNLMKGDGKKS